jgi:hypothetical protein
VVGPEGWRRIGPDPAILAWARAALAPACRALAQAAGARRCGGTWAVGLDLLDNDAAGAVAGQAVPLAALPLEPVALHRGQLSAVYPGYPRASAEETPAAFRFRLNRDAAHLDGLLPVGPARRRMLQEPHAWILGLPLTDCGPAAAPLVVYEGSHLILQRALAAALSPHPPAQWDRVDLTEAYAAARAEVFARCPRLPLPARPGEATLLHRLTLHGVAPWAEGDAAEAPPEGRIIAYFRPLMASVQAWALPP